LGGAELMSSLGTENTELIKLGISTLLIGAYILSSIHEKELHIFKSRIKSKYVTEKTLQGLTALMTGIFLWNSFNLGIDIIANIKF
jgi:preprotein translocase subunit SecG